MFFLACPLDPWARTLARDNAIPRILALDLEVLTVYDEHEELLVEAVLFTIAYIRGLGGRISTDPRKTYLYSTSVTVRQCFRLFQWPHVGCLLVLTHWRDLGSQASTSTCLVAPTLSARLICATAYVVSIDQLPASFHVRCALVARKALPMGLYGCESSSVNDSKLRRFRGQIFKF